MIGKTLRIYGRRRGWYQGKRSVFGLFRGYQVTIRQRLLFGVPQHETICLHTEAIPPDRREAIGALLEEARFSILFARPSVTEKSICLKYRKLYTYSDRHEITETLDQLVDLVEAQGLHPHFTPPPAGERLRFCLHRGEGVVLHEQEYQLLRGRREVAESPRVREEYHYLRGLSGAARYGLAGVAGVVLLAYVFQPFPTLSGLGVGYLAAYGYVQLRGFRGEYTLPLLALVSVALSGLAVWMSAWVHAGGEGGPRDYLVALSVGLAAVLLLLYRMEDRPVGYEEAPAL